jgi:hypothetical protein
LERRNESWESFTQAQKELKKWEIRTQINGWTTKVEHTWQDALLRDKANTIDFFINGPGVMTLQQGGIQLLNLLTQ